MNRLKLLETSISKGFKCHIYIVYASEKFYSLSMHWSLIKRPIWRVSMLSLMHWYIDNLSEFFPFSYDIFIDIVGGVLIGLGIYNFAANAEFPLAGVSGLALILYRLFNISVMFNLIEHYKDNEQNLNKRAFCSTFHLTQYYLI